MMIFAENAQLNPAPRYPDNTPKAMPNNRTGAERNRPGSGPFKVDRRAGRKACAAVRSGETKPVGLCL